MSGINLDCKSFVELKQLHNDIIRAISTYEARRKAEARHKVEALAKELGFSVSELIGTKSKPRRTPVAPKYQHPENPSLTWSGRGRKPKWFHDILALGKIPEVMANGRVAN